jgi:glycosyltransferase involved in cell wall biosynthesis
MSAAPIRVMRIITRLNVGSPAMHAVLLTQRLGPPEYESTLVCGANQPQGGSMAYFAEAHAVAPVYISELGDALDPITTLRLIRRLYLLMRQHRPDIVHTHMARAGFAGRAAARLAGVPVIVHTFHGHVFSGEFNPVSTRLFVALERLAARWSDTIITQTQSTRRELAEVYRVTRQGRMTILPLGLDLDTFAQTPRGLGGFRREWGIAPDAPLIGIVGRMVAVKNHALFLDAAALIRAQQPDARFVIVGDGETRADIEAQLDRLNLRGCVVLTGWQRDIAPLYSDLDVLVNSSDSEGTPTPLIEALTVGCTVVATAVGGVPDLLSHGSLGRLVLPGSAESLADAVLQTLAEPPQGAHARDVMLNRYGIDRLAADLDSLYHGLLAKKGRAQVEPV